MRSTKRSGITALTAAIALALGAVPVALTVPATMAGGGTSAGTLQAAATNVGVPDLSLTATDTAGTVSWGSKTQIFTGGQFCAITPSPSSTATGLLTITGQVGPTIDSTDLAGFRSGQIGVFEQSNASQCFRVDAGSSTTTETLGLKLGPDLRDNAGPLMAQSASLDLEMRTNDVQLNVKAYLTDPQTGRAKVAEFELRTGQYQKLPPTAGVTVTTSPARTGGHVYWTLPGSASAPYFDELQVEAVKGSISIEGGNHTGKATTFDLVSRADTYFCSGGSDTYTEANVKVAYLGNADGSTCRGFDVRVEAGDENVGFYKPLDVDPNAQFIFDLSWTKANDGDPTVQINTPKIDFEIKRADGTVLETIQDMPFCPRTGAATLYDSTGKLVGVTGTSSQRAATLTALQASYVDMVPDDSAVPATAGYQLACVGEPRNVQILGSQFKIQDRVFLIGDARMSMP